MSCSIDVAHCAIHPPKRWIAALTLSALMHGLWLWNSPASPSLATGPQGLGSPSRFSTVQARAVTATRATEPSSATTHYSAQAARVDTPVASPSKAVSTNNPAPSDDYLPRSALSVAPQPSSEVLLTYPDDAPAGQWRAEITVFIDAQGTVRRVRVDSPELPTPLADIARQAFLSTRYRPGEVNGQPVNARVRIEVSFEANIPPRSLRAP